VMREERKLEICEGWREQIVCRESIIIRLSGVALENKSYKNRYGLPP